ncbi:MAG: RluA family pseudouridine synthase [Pseudomonadota bacterium]
MSAYNLTVKKEFVGKRVDVFLAEALPEYTRARFQKLIKQGNVLVNGKVAKSAHAVKENEKVQVEVPPPIKHDALAEKIPLNVLYEDKDIIVINKSADMVVHPAAGNWTGTLVNALLAHCQDLSGVGGELKPGIVHRLDKGTSGVIVAAKNDLAHLDLSQQFKDRTVKKIYLAVVIGSPKDDSGKIETAIGRSVKDRKKYSSKTRKGRVASTEWKIYKRLSQDLTVLEVKLNTGRTHQIRVHLAEIGLPLVGDQVYGGRKARKIKFGRPALHAWRLGFKHPTKKQWLEFEAPLPDDIKCLLFEQSREQ